MARGDELSSSDEEEKSREAAEVDERREGCATPESGTEGTERRRPDVDTNRSFQWR